MPKKHVFFKPSRSAKKSQKASHGIEKVAPGFNGECDSAKMVPTNEKKIETGTWDHTRLEA
jgi:hypothetical protein